MRAELAGIIRRRIPLVSIATTMMSLALGVMACQIDLGGPLPPGPPIVVSQEASAQVQQNWQSALEAAATTGSVTVLLTESQVTSFLSQRLAASEEAVLDNPQVYLRDGAIEVFGGARQGPIRANVHVSISPRIDDQGALGFEITSANFGPIPAPDFITDSVSTILSEAFTGTLGSLATGIRITTIAIADGELAVVGELR